MIIGIGCDIVDIYRVTNAMEKGHMQRILTQKEQAGCAQTQSKRNAEWIAGRFAGKEAIYKALSAHCNVPLCDIEILSDAHGAPYCTMETYDIQISIAHEHDYAIAYAIVQSKEMDDSCL